MSSIGQVADATLYRKRGRVARLENGTMLDIAERGIAWERNGIFFCQPEPGEHLPPIDPRRVAAVADAIRRAAGAQIDIERLIVSEGRAEHSLGERVWSESSERVHLALTAGRLRVLVDLGSFDLHDVRAAVEALERARQQERRAPEHLRLARSVAAALLPNLALRPREPVRIVQTAGGVDGAGKPIEEWDTVERPWPNCYRPSYRTRPVNVPLNVRAIAPHRDIDAGLPVAIALLEPPRGTTVRVLIDDGSEVFPATVEVTTVTAVGTDAVWYPLGAGSFGAEMML